LAPIHIIGGKEGVLRRQRGLGGKHGVLHNVVHVMTARRLTLAVTPKM
jgi:hypothetical protein